jgi:hypothetical protein
MRAKVVNEIRRSKAELDTIGIGAVKMRTAFEIIKPYISHLESRSVPSWAGFDMDEIRNVAARELDERPEDLLQLFDWDLPKEVRGKLLDVVGPQRADNKFDGMTLKRTSGEVEMPYCVAYYDGAFCGMLQEPEIGARVNLIFYVRYKDIKITHRYD